MELWKKNLIEYMTAKEKPRDLIIHTTNLNIKLIAILQQLKDEIETYQDFTIELRRKRFIENINFPLPASTFVIKYENEDMVEYMFQWVQEEEGDNLQLKAIVNNIAHQRFDQQLKELMGEEPIWLKECVFCSPYEKDLGPADDLNEEALGLFVVDTFLKMTEKFLV